MISILLGATDERGAEIKVLAGPEVPYAKQRELYEKLVLEGKHTRIGWLRGGTLHGERRRRSEDFVKESRTKAGAAIEKARAAVARTRAARAKALEPGSKAKRDLVALDKKVADAEAKLDKLLKAEFERLAKRNRDAAFPPPPAQDDDELEPEGAEDSEIGEDPEGADTTEGPAEVEEPTDAKEPEN